MNNANIKERHPSYLKKKKKSRRLFEKRKGYIATLIKPGSMIHKCNTSRWPKL
jgi:hypothetical protein